ncbi:hypothetical protein [Deinococcus pimensis]|nr:hypothetical protein [Deinococcus pimensis]
MARHRHRRKARLKWQVRATTAKRVQLALLIVIAAELLLMFLRT